MLRRIALLFFLTGIACLASPLRDLDDEGDFFGDKYEVLPLSDVAADQYLAVPASDFFSEFVTSSSFDAFSDTGKRGEGRGLCAPPHLLTRFGASRSLIPLCLLR